MVVRVRWRHSDRLIQREFALAAGSCLMLLALLTFTVALVLFAVRVEGWHAWLAIAAMLSLAAYLFGEYGKINAFTPENSKS